MSGDIADGMERCAADLARALGDLVRHGEDLLRMLVEKQMIIAKVAPAHVPVKILRLQVKHEDVGKQSTQAA